MTSYLAAWLFELDRLLRVQRCRTRDFQRFDRHARTWLTPEVIRAEVDLVAVAEVERRLRLARYPFSTNLHDLDRVWSRAELGVLITEATNRARQLATADPRRQPGPALDPARIPDERLDHLIQRHRDMAVVEACRAERQRRTAAARPTFAEAA